MVVKMNGTEQDFVHRINVKEEAAFHDLFTRFRNYLVLFAMRRIDQLDAAEDIVQETFITVWENKKIYNSYQGLKAYLYELVQNKCTNYLKHKQVQDTGNYIWLSVSCRKSVRGFLNCTWKGKRMMRLLKYWESPC